MHKRYVVTVERRTYVGRPETIVAALAADTWHPTDNWIGWMDGAAARAGELAGQPIRHDSPDHFLRDLQRAGLISLAETN